MKFYFVALALVLITLQQRLLLAELQGPPKDLENTSTKTDEAETTENLNESPISAEVSETSKDTSEKTEESKEGATAGSNNDRKSSKLLQDAAKIPDFQITMGQRNKVLPAAIFERLYNEQLLKQNLMEQIKEIEAQRRVPHPIDPSPEQIEAHSLYEKAKEMLSKSHTDKKVAYQIMGKAAALNHYKARAEMAWAYLLGHHVKMNFEFAAAEFDSLAAEGEPDANMGLAFLYSIGVGGKNVSQPRALIHLTLAALGDNTFAQMALGYRYSFGINVPMSCEQSLMYYKKVAKKVASKITFSSGQAVHRVRLLDESENPGSQETEIVDYYQLLADKGDVQSQVGLGQLYYQGGKAIQQDHQKALEYFRAAANSGNAIGYAFMGKLYLEGNDFIKADNETAFKYFKKAADMGDPVGQSGLGLMYLKGLGVPQDSHKALTYFTQAADQGWVDGQLQLGNMYFTGNGVKTDYKLALKYFNLASQSGHVLAYYNLGIMHTYGMGMLRSCPAAVEFFKNVAERGRWGTNLMLAYSDYKNYRLDEAFMQYALLAEMGYEVAQANAAFLLDRGDVTIFHDRHEELIRAFYYWKRAAAQGYSAAQVKLGDYYYYGWGTDVDYETAAALYRKASEQQYNAQAMFNLGYMHEKGLGMKKDWHLAKRLYDLAAETNADAKVPVAMALMKLQVLAKIEAIKESPYKFIFFMDENIAANWDLYMITILTLLLGFIMYTRRPYQQQQQQQQQQQNVAPAPAANAGAAAPASAPSSAVQTDTQDNLRNRHTPVAVDNSQPTTSQNSSNSNTTTITTTTNIASPNAEKTVKPTENTTITDTISTTTVTTTVTSTASTSVPSTSQANRSPVDTVE